ncbi:hypothetical protein CFN78_16485 [Amycolatopsis antarctica]|uniref:Uncharacterized protein n=1 Tax=Amycolatopsis antarctica TaxID=1854586 RepID=A0A263D3V5_9PSEU|nr:hypothetical protein [Amycolatopsis antarctica]OZM72136.1 hypothetical protein CFN78_16485 [Amycolatopsis antarctica]
MARQTTQVRGATAASQIECKQMGRAMVVHRRGHMSEVAQSLAWSIAEDPDNDIVVLDLPDNCPVWMWEAVATSLPKRRRGLRLVVGARSHGMTAMTGQWLSERLRRTVYAPDGMVVRGTAGTLFVHSGPESGWVRFTPGKAPRWEAKRFPRPRWEGIAVDHPWPTSSGGVAEPIPGGVWLRSMHTAPGTQDHRRLLAQAMLVQRDRLAVVLGCPGSVPLPLDDIARLWVNLPPEARRDVRFVRFGPLNLPPGVSVGQAIADVVDQPVIVSQGMPLEGVDGSVVRIVHPNGALGWRPFVRELGFNPRRMTGGVATLPTVLDYDTPLEGLPEISSGVFQYTPDAALEVVQGGLWLRPAEGAVQSEAVRATPLDPAHFWFVYDCQSEAVSSRMRTLAQDVIARLDADIQPFCRLLPASSIACGAVRRTAERLGRAGGVAMPAVDRMSDGHSAAAGRADLVWEGDQPAVPAEVGATHTGSGLVRERAAEVATHSDVGLESTDEDDTAVGQVAKAGAEERTATAVADVGSIAERLAPDQGAQAAARPLPSPAHESEPTERISTAGKPAGQRRSTAPPLAAAAGVRLESTLDYDDASLDLGLGHDGLDDHDESDTTDTETAGSKIEASHNDGPLATERKTVGVRPQPVPEPEAAALLPATGIEKERAWLRRTLSRQFDNLSTSAGRLLSEQPGLRSQGHDRDVITDLVALRLYLSEEGETLDEALHTATVGPHVPFARCVVAGLRRLGTHRGRVSLRAQVEPEHLDWYQDNPRFADWSFVNCLPTGPGNWPGNCDIDIWSLSGRRTTGLEPQASGLDERVIFPPGTRFKLLGMERADTPDGRHRIVLRECGAAEAGDDDGVNAAALHYDDMATVGLERVADTPGFSGATPPDATVARLSSLPGLVTSW